MQLSYRKQLSIINESLTDEGVSYRNFESVSESLKKTMLAMGSPQPRKWSVTSEYKNSDFHESSQGVAHNGTHWFFTANGNKGRQGVFKYTTSMRFIKGLKLTGNSDLLHLRNVKTYKAMIKNKLVTLPKFGHVGDPECYKGTIYLPMQNPHGFLTMNTNLDASSVKWYPTPKIGDSHPWCAINPLNGKLYTSSFLGEDLNKSEYKLTLYAYNPDTCKREPDYDIHLKTATVRVQGGCFSPNGTLFLTSDAKETANHIRKSSKINSAKTLIEKIFDETVPGNLTVRLPRDKYTDNIKSVIASGVPLRPCITFYSPVNGHYFGFAPIMREISTMYKQEVEGITYWERLEKGKKTQLHVVLLENELGTDEVFFKHYSK